MTRRTIIEAAIAKRQAPLRRGLEFKTASLLSVAKHHADEDRVEALREALKSARRDGDAMAERLAYRELDELLEGMQRGFSIQFDGSQWTSKEDRLGDDVTYGGRSE